MKSSSLKLVDSGIANPSHYRDSLIHTWTLQDDYASHLQVYMLKETSVDDFLLHSKDGELFIQEKKYSLIYIHSPAKIKKADSRRLLLSIRYCRDLDRGYALVKILEVGNFDRLEY